MKIPHLENAQAAPPVASGVSLKVIQQYLGHSSLQTTMIYLHLTDTAEQHAREKIEKLFHRDK